MRINVRIKWNGSSTSDEHTKVSNLLMPPTPAFSGFFSAFATLSSFLYQVINPLITPFRPAICQQLAVVDGSVRVLSSLLVAFVNSFRAQAADAIFVSLAIFVFCVYSHDVPLVAQKLHRGQLSSY